MSSPLEIMDEIGCYIRADSKVLLIFPDEWQSLRTAIEARDEELLVSKKGWDGAESRASMCADALHEAHEELAQARARIAVLMEIGHAAWHLLDSTCHDMSKDIYEVPAQDVAALEKALDLTGHFDFHDYMQEHPAQSLAAVRAEALRGALDGMRSAFPVPEQVEGWINDEAERIER